jgi:hypothetical protein
LRGKLARRGFRPNFWNGVGPLVEGPGARIPENDNLSRALRIDNFEAGELKALLFDVDHARLCGQTNWLPARRP